MEAQKTFTLFWLDGKSEIVKGSNPAIAMTLAGYGGGAVRALDFYGNGDKRNDYAWDAGARSWEPINTES